MSLAPEQAIVANLLVRVRRCQSFLRGYTARTSLRAALDRFQDDTDDYTRDPRFSVPVSRFGTARPPVKRDMVTDHLPRHTGSGKVEWEEVRRVKDQIDRLFEGGQIDEDAYNAARLFHTEFAKCGYDSCRTTNLAGASGGGMSIEDIYTRSCRARDYVFNTLYLLGGPSSAPATVICFYVGFLHDMKSIAGIDRGNRVAANQKGRNRDYWTGVLHASLRIMGEDYKKMMRGKPRKSRLVAMPSTDLVVPDKNRY